MTLYLAFKAIEDGRLKPTDRVKMSRHAASRPPSKIGLRVGATLTVREAIDLIIVRSANDVAAALAEEIGGSEREFARMMTREAKRLGMTKTRFVNASGLPDRRQVTTARDLAVLAKAVRRDFPQQYRLFNQQQTRFRGRTVRGHNALLATRGVDGLKTGYTHASGFNLITSAHKGPRRLIAVVMGGRTARTRDAYMDKLIKAGFTATSRADERRVTVASLMGAQSQPLGPLDVRTAQGGSEMSPSDEGARWRIQVGAFHDRENAEVLLDQLAEEGSPIPDRAKPKLRREGHLHLARFAGLTEAEAASGCRALIKQGADCLVMAPRSN